MQFWDPSTPNEEVMKLVGLLRPSMDVLDMGANEGRHAIALAERGCQVVAVEPNHEAFGRLKQNVDEMPGQITAIEDNLLTYQPDRLFDAVICTMVLHFFPATEIKPALEKMQAWTRPGGYHVISGYSDKNPPGKRPYLFGHNELSGYYDGWKIISYEEKPTPWFRYPAGTEPRRNEAVYLIAQKGPTVQ